MAAGTLDQAYAYAGPSTAEVTPDGAALQLATSGGSAPHPRLFAGTLTAPAAQATALLVVGRCARSRFFRQMNPLLADPVITCHADRLRFEALSSCASVYVRHDADLSGADGEVLRPGVSNVDLGPAARTVLARVASGSTLHLEIGDDGLAISSEHGGAIERRVPLPVRWVKGFGEVGVAQRSLTEAFALDGVAAARFLRAVPSGGARGLHAVPGARTPRWSTVPSTGSVAVRDASRLRLLEPLARHARRLVVFGAPGGGSAWQLDTPAGRTHLVMSPAAYRGFSGEGGVLTPLAAEALGPVADQVALELAWQPVLDHAVLSARTGHPAAAVAGALTVLAARGRTGFDLETGHAFHRDLPFDLTRVEALHPRLRAARLLVAEGRVELAGGGEAWVRGPHSEHRVRLTDVPPTCSCSWWAQHRGERGPCKHVLAAELARDGGDGLGDDGADLVGADLLGGADD